MRNLHLTGLVLALLAAGAAFAADLSGTWTGEAHTNEGGVYQFVLTVKADGDSLTGTAGRASAAREIENGKISGDEISFSITYKNPAGTRKVNYSGKLDDGKLKMTSQFEGSARKLAMTLERQ